MAPAKGAHECLFRPTHKGAPCLRPCPAELCALSAEYTQPYALQGDPGNSMNANRTGAIGFSSPLLRDGVFSDFVAGNVSDVWAKVLASWPGGASPESLSLHVSAAADASRSGTLGVRVRIQACHVAHPEKLRARRCRQFGSRRWAAEVLRS